MVDPGGGGGGGDAAGTPSTLKFLSIMFVFLILNQNSSFKKAQIAQESIKKTPRDPGHKGLQASHS